MEKCGIHFVQASDEFYLTARRPLPEPSRYDGYPQLENGVGMLTLLHEEIGEALSAVVPSAQTETVSTFSGLLAAPSLARELARIGEKLPAKKILFYPLENHFFGEKITVTGLLTGAGYSGRSQREAARRPPAAPAVCVSERRGSAARRHDARRP